VVVCLEQDADLHMAQLMPLPLTVSCFRKIQTGFTFLVPAHLGSPGKRAVKRVCVCVCYNNILGRITCTECKMWPLATDVPAACYVYVYVCVCLLDVTNRDAVWDVDSGEPKEPCIKWAQVLHKKAKVAHTRLSSVGFRS